MKSRLSIVYLDLNAVLAPRVDVESVVCFRVDWLSNTVNTLREQPVDFS